MMLRSFHVKIEDRLSYNTLNTTIWKSKSLTRFSMGAWDSSDGETLAILSETITKISNFFWSKTRQQILRDLSADVVVQW